jgi:hypothetical protein
VHAEAEVQDTARRELNCAPEGLVVGWIRHALPFHRSANVPASEPPTAVHAEVDVQATLMRKPPRAEGLGVASIRHPVPSQRSANGTDTPELLTRWPTPMHAEGDEQDTPNSALSLAPAGLAAAWVAHLPPTRCSTRGTTTPKPVVKSPTAVQEDEPEQETPRSCPVCADRFPVGTIDHPEPGVGAGVARARPAGSCRPVAITAAWADAAITTNSKKKIRPGPRQIITPSLRTRNAQARHAAPTPNSFRSHSAAPLKTNPRSAPKHRSIPHLREGADTHRADGPERALTSVLLAEGVSQSLSVCGV